MWWKNKKQKNKRSHWWPARNENLLSIKDNWKPCHRWLSTGQNVPSTFKLAGTFWCSSCCGESLDLLLFFMCFSGQSSGCPTNCPIWSYVIMSVFGEPEAIFPSWWTIKLYSVISCVFCVRSVSLFSSSEISLLLLWEGNAPKLFPLSQLNDYYPCSLTRLRGGVKNTDILCKKKKILRNCLSGCQRTVKTAKNFKLLLRPAIFGPFWTSLNVLSIWGCSPSAAR